MRIPSDQLVQQHIDEAAIFVADEAASMFRHIVPLIVQGQRIMFDSPLEELFHLWWIAVMETHAKVMDSFPESLSPQLIHHYELLIRSKTYELDFAVIVNRANWRGIAVELDGHEFHERTPEQVKIRDRRDRALQAAGWFIFHFSFNEFNTAPLRCVEEVFNRTYNQITSLIAGEACEMSA